MWIRSRRSKSRILIRWIRISRIREWITIIVTVRVLVKWGVRSWKLRKLDNL